MALSAMRSPVSGNFNPMELITTKLDHYLAGWLRHRILGNKDLDHKLSTDEKRLLNQLKERCQLLSKCAQSINPRFTLPFQLKVHTGPDTTCGGNIIYLSRRSLQSPLDIKKTLTLAQKEVV